MVSTLHALHISLPFSLTVADSAISDDDMAIVMPRDGGISAGKRKACEVEFDTMPQEVVEGLIRKDVDHISSIFGVSVSSLVSLQFGFP